MHGQPRLHAAIPHKVRQLLAELELISHGSTQSWNSAGGAHGESTAVLPYGESNPPHVHLRELYIAQVSEDGRARVVVKITVALSEARGQVDRSHVIGESREHEDARMITQGEGFTPDEVALKFHCTPTRVRRVRAANSRSIELGLPLSEPTNGLPAADRRRRAREYHSQGMTLNQIGQLLGCDKATISRDLKAA